MTGRFARVAGPALAVLVLAAAVGWMPARRAEQSAHARIDAAERLVGELEWEVEALEALVADEQALRSELDVLTVAIPEDHDLADLILDLERLAGTTGMELVDVVPASVLGPFDDPRTPPGTNSIVVAVALRGDFLGLLDLVARIVEEPRLIIVDSVGLGTADAEDTLLVDLELRVFTTRELVVADDGFDDALDEEVDG